MAVKIRLKRSGKRGQANYRIVVIDESKARQGKEIEIIGSYHPHESTAKQLILKSVRADYWLTRGAVPTDTMRHLIKKAANSKSPKTKDQRPKTKLWKN